MVSPIIVAAFLGRLNQSARKPVITPNRPTPIVITDRNETLFSTGRQRLVDETLAELQAGYIGTGVNQP